MHDSPPLSKHKVQLLFSAVIALALWGLPFSWQIHVVQAEESKPNDLILQPLPTANDTLRQIGAARIEITPQRPILLSGYAARNHQLQLNVKHKLWAHALAISDEASPPAILLTVDNVGVPASVRQAVVSRLKDKFAIAPERVTLSSTHTHGGPMLTGVLENLLTREMTPAERAAVDDYTNELIDKLVEVAANALNERQPGYLLRGTGKVEFAINRRGEMVVDHSMPLLAAVDKQGKLFAVVANYACHCVSASNGMMLTSDWAGCAVAELRQALPDVVGMVTIGCGGDQNPADKGGVEASERQGKQLADEVLRVLQTKLKPVNGPLQIEFQEIKLPLAELPNEKQWQELSTTKGIVGYHAQTNLKRLQHGEALTDSVIYPVQTWQFGNDLTMVFLGDEVVVDYALLIKNKHGEQTWVSGYTNDVTCYIPSERVLRRGGYEGRTSMLWYDKPAPFATGLEKAILDEVDRQLTPQPEVSDEHARTGGVAPRSPQESIETMHVNDRFRVEVVAVEPLVIDPVAIDFGPDGRLWVVEMNDYPLGVEGKPAGGGRVKFLEDRDQDGHFDEATLFLEDLPYPTGVKAWGKGVLICAAPDVIYAEDTNGDGRADVRRVVLSGFATHNYQARVNSLSLGLDSWWYGAGGIFGGQLQSQSMSGVDAENRDFRFQPETGIVEAVSGRTQQGRARDDWGNWFGCTNSNLLYYYPSIQHYYERNPLANPPNPIPSISSGEKLFPLGDLVRFSLSGAKGTPTSVCGLEIYRDERLGKAFSNNALVCEPVNQLVHRREVVLGESTVTSRRPAEEQQREFLASTDNWFRPVQVRTAPDGSLWVVDMYRYVIEHPKFISDQVKAKLDVRAGDDRRRIYRILPVEQTASSLPNLRELATSELALQLDTVNGTLRDMVHAELLFRRDTACLPILKKLTTEAALPQVRLQALCVLDGLDEIDERVLDHASHDSHFAVRKQVVVIAEKKLTEHPQAEKWIRQALDDPAMEVRIQAAYSLGECRSESAATCLATYLFADSTSPAVRVALRTSLHAGSVQAVLDVFNSLPVEAKQHHRDLLISVAQVAEPGVAKKVLALSIRTLNDFPTMAKIVAVLETRKIPLQKGADLPGLTDQVTTVVLDDSAPLEQRLAAIELFAIVSAADSDATNLLLELMSPRQPQQIQAKALATIFKLGSPVGQQAILDQFLSYSPQLQTATVGEYLARPEGTRLLLTGLESGLVPRGMIDLADRQKLLDHPSGDIQKRAATIFAASSQGSLQEKVEQLRRADLRGGDLAAGRTLFQQQCAACHRYDELGSAVGPDLQTLTDRTKDFMVTAILDPNAAVDRRYATYSVLLNDGRVLGGILAEESNQAITLKEKEGVQRRILRSDIEEIKGTGKSLMPEGLEQVIPQQGMKDLLAFLGAVELQPMASKSSSKQFESVQQLRIGRQAIEEGKDEYAEIPRLFHIALAAGQRNEGDEVLAILQSCLPHNEEPLSDWQTVVLGAVVKGISETGVWPQKRIDGLLTDDEPLKQRWSRMLELAAQKAEDTAVHKGTRYDALRLIPLRSWDTSQEALIRYAAAGNNADLIRGAIEGLGDVPHMEAAVALHAALPGVPDNLREFAVHGLLRADGDHVYLLEALSAKLLSPKSVSQEIRQGLISHPNRVVRKQAENLLQ